MAFATDTTEFPQIGLKPEALVSLPVGVASPLWGFYAGAALSGVAYWWMTQWARPVNFEALFGAATAAAPQAAALAPTPAEVVETLTPELARLPATPIGGEAGPISAVTAAEAVAEAVTEPVVQVAEATRKAVEEAVATTPPAPGEAAAAAAPEPRSVTPKAKPAAEQPRSA